ncbi:MAG: MerR family transcriptional regulator [Oscillospiraceae bacterium]
MYQIGEFSKICQVSVKTLRHYDRIGLMKPAEVDRFTGYRYYDRSQLEKMLLIQKLKRYGFSLEEIQSLMLCDDGAVFIKKLMRQKEVLEWKQMETGMVIQELTLHLENLKRTGNFMEMQNERTIKVVKTERMAVLACRHRMAVDDFGRYYGTLYERIAKESIAPSGIFGAMYHDEEFNRDASDIELFIGVREEAHADKILDQQDCAMTVHKGTYSTLSETYASLVAWIEENGYAWNGAPYEIYTKTAQNGLKPQDWETEVYFPVKKA